MYSICKLIAEQDRLPVTLQSLAEGESRFTAEIGVLDRDFFQCIQQPHVIWSCTRWTGERAHNRAAESMMEIRRDDRSASACFRPGLYYEIFARPLRGGSRSRDAEGKANFVVVSHGLVADKKHARWTQDLRARMARLESISGLLRVRTFYNYYCDREFVGLWEWRDEDAYARERWVGHTTVEESAYVGPLEAHTDLASYVQYECRPLDVARKEAVPCLSR